MRFIIGKEAFHFEAHVIEDLTYDVIIGRDFLQYFRSRIDFDNDVLTFSREENYLPFCDVETDCLSDDVEDGSSDFICSVHADFSFTIPPKEDVSPACFARSVNYANLCSKWRSRSCPPAIFGPFCQVRISLQ